MSPKVNNLLSSIVIASLLTLGLSCNHAHSQDRDDVHSKTQGLIPHLRRTLPAPKPIPSTRLRAALTAVAKQFLSSKARDQVSDPAAIRRGLMDFIFIHIVAEGGMPRWQIRNLLSNLIDEDRALCAGIPCSQAFGLRQETIEDYLDEMLGAVKKDPRLRDTDHQKTFSTLLASLESDVITPRQGKPDQQVRFVSEAVREAAQRAAHRPDGVTYGDLSGITHLDIRRYHNKPFTLDELVLFPKLKTITLHIWDLSDINQFLKIAHLLEGVELAHSFLTKIDKVSLSDLENLSDFNRIKSVVLSDIAIDQPHILPKIFPWARQLKITNFSRWQDQISDHILEQVSRLPRLRTLEIGIHSAEPFKNLRYTMPRSIRDVRVALSPQGRRDCGTLSMMAIFRHALSLTVSQCGLSALGGLGGEVAWKSLKLEQPFHVGRESEALVLKLTPEFKNLLTFESTNKAVDLDPSSRHELALRLALQQEP